MDQVESTPPPSTNTMKHNAQSSSVDMVPVERLVEDTTTDDDDGGGWQDVRFALPPKVHL